MAAVELALQAARGPHGSDAVRPAAPAPVAWVHEPGLDGLRAVNSSARADVSRTREDRTRGQGEKRDYLAEHPVVRTHPETGRKALYVNLAHTSHFVGMTEAESAPLLDYLFQLQIRPEHTCRFSWRAGSVALWDNRCALHNPINDYHGHRRLLHRITLAGDVPR